MSAAVSFQQKLEEVGAPDESSEQSLATGKVWQPHKSFTGKIWQPIAIYVLPQV